MSPDLPRIPNFKRLLIGGALVGIVVGILISLGGDEAPGYSETSAALYLGAFGAVIGLAVAGVLGVVLERLGRSGH